MSMFRSCDVMFDGGGARGSEERRMHGQTGSVITKGVSWLWLINSCSFLIVSLYFLLLLYHRCRSEKAIRDGSPPHQP